MSCSDLSTGVLAPLNGFLDIVSRTGAADVLVRSAKASTADTGGDADELFVLVMGQTGFFIDDIPLGGKARSISLNEEDTAGSSSLRGTEPYGNVSESALDFAGGSSSTLSSEVVKRQVDSSDKRRLDNPLCDRGGGRTWSLGPIRLESRSDTVTSPPVGVKFRAFDTRFLKTCAILLLSTSMSALCTAIPWPHCWLFFALLLGDDGTVKNCMKLAGPWVETSSRLVLSLKLSRLKGSKGSRMSQCRVTPFLLA